MAGGVPEHGRAKPEDCWDVIVIGGGAAGFFGAIHAAEPVPGARVCLLEKSQNVLTKVRISGGGRCNLTHECSDPRELVKNYPRGAAFLLQAFHRWSTSDTKAWFQARGMPVKVEPDGRVFPCSDSSQSVIQVLIKAASDAGVRVFTGVGVRGIKPVGSVWKIEDHRGVEWTTRMVLVATGGRREGNPDILHHLDFSIVPSVLSLFTFEIRDPLLQGLAGLSVPLVKLQAGDHAAQGPLLITHRGLSGPAVLRLSAWAARPMFACRYHFPLTVDWLGDWSTERLDQEWQMRRKRQGGRRLTSNAVGSIPGRLWERLVAASGLPADLNWSQLSAHQARALTGTLKGRQFLVVGKALNKEEFVTCGGVDLKEVDARTFEARRFPGLFFAGEVLDIDGLTGGFNFQAAWTGGVLASREIARRLVRSRRFVEI